MQYKIEKDISEEAETVGRILAHHNLEEYLELAADIEKTFNSNGRVFLIGAGTSYHACLYARYLFAKENKFFIDIYRAGEFLPYLHDVNHNDLVVFVSQSGETSDILEAVDAAKKVEPKMWTIVNDQNTSLHQKVGRVAPLMAGKEGAVPATKTYLATLSVFGVLADILNYKKPGIVAVKDKIIGDINEKVGEEYRNSIKLLAEKLGQKQDLFILGSEENLASAFEGALKLKEIANVDAEGYSIKEFLHGPISLARDNCATLIFQFGSDRDTVDRVSNKVKSQGGDVVLIGDDTAENNINASDMDVFSAINNIVPIQLLAVEIAKTKGVDPDNPRGVEKVVGE